MTSPPRCLQCEVPCCALKLAPYSGPSRRQGTRCRWEFCSDSQRVERQAAESALRTAAAKVTKAT